jgi:hypothetical protein
VEKKKYDLCLEVLRRMKREGILDKIMLAGSWCVILYEDYFKGKSILPVIRTRDLEFLFPVPLNLDRKTDLYDLLKDLGFVLDFKGEQGYIIFQHPDLILEFLVPARGKGSVKPFPLKQLGINAQALRFMDALPRNPIQTQFNDVTVTLPHPIDFALHKLLIAGRRKDKEKAEKDRAQAIALLIALNASGEIENIRKVFDTMPKSWRKTIRRELLGLGEEQLIELIEGS